MNNRPKVPKKCLGCGARYLGGHAWMGEPMKDGLRVFYKCGASLSIKENLGDGVYLLLFKNCGANYEKQPKEKKIMKQLLIVEDSPHTASILKKVLERDGFEVVSVTNGNDALERIEREKPALILLDLLLPKPGIDGHEVCRRIRSNLKTKDIPIIVITGIGEEAAKKGLEAGADDYLLKPFDLFELRDMVLNKLKEMI